MTTNTIELQYADLFKNCFEFSKLFTYQAKFPFFYESEHYIVKTAHKLKELYAIFKLRQEAFLLHDQNCNIPFLIDIDEHDFHCDHVVIIDKKNQKVCGTYRMKTSLTADKFYSEGEFDLGTFKNEAGIKLELGRACIHPDYRTGGVIDHLWKGIALYARETNSRYLFGCSSVKLTDIKLIGELNHYLKSQNLLSTSYGIKPIGDFLMENLKDEEFTSESKKLIPGLLRSYLQAGAKIHGDPAFDVDFNCIDYLTILDLKNVDGLFSKRYFKLG